MTAPPPARREEVVDVLHGHHIADPYRWLERGDDPEVVDWVAAQNAHTRSILDADPARARWHGDLVELIQLPVVLAAQVRGEHVFCLERPAGAEQFLLTRRSMVDADRPPVVLLDPAAGMSDAAAAVDWFEASADGALVAVGVSEGGTERSILRVLATADGRDTGEPEIPDTRACSVAWVPDGTGFVYTRYPDGDEYHRTVHEHRLGSPWRDDPVVWAEHPAPTAWPDVTLSPDGRRLLVRVEVGWARTDVHVLDRAAGEWTTVIAGIDATSELDFAADGMSLVGVTTYGAPRGRLVAVPAGARSPEEWVTLVDESDAVLGHAEVSGEEILVVSTRRAVDEVLRFGADGTPRARIEGLGDVIAVAGLSVDRAGGPGIAVVDSFGAPTTAWRIGDDGSAAHWFPAAPEATVVPDLVVRQATYPSLDGTPIGMFLVHRRDVTPGPDVPAILNGYGGFAIAETPVWSPQIAAWCGAGGLYAIAGLRGGLEEGQAWHHAGRRATKQNVFDDFHAGADWLVDQRLVDRERLAVLGRSNGGLLVGVALTQRPDLCRAVWCGVPLLDMVRFPQFLMARLWTDEYGDPDAPEELEWLLAYSPYHHVADGTAYPATLLTTAEGDSRVDPLHARKMAALLQAASSAEAKRPVLLFQEGRAGHGVGKPVAKRADELADGLTFLGAQLALSR